MKGSSRQPRAQFLITPIRTKPQPPLSVQQLWKGNFRTNRHLWENVARRRRSNSTTQSLNPQRSSALKLFSAKKDILVPMSAQLIITCYDFKDGAGVSASLTFLLLTINHHVFLWVEDYLSSSSRCDMMRYTFHFPRVCCLLICHFAVFKTVFVKPEKWNLLWFLFHQKVFFLNFGQHWSKHMDLSPKCPKQSRNWSSVNLFKEASSPTTVIQSRVLALCWVYLL